MDLYRKSGIATGILFLVGTAAGISSLATQPIIEAPDYLAKIAGQEPAIALSAGLILVMGLACAGIAIAMYPVLRRQSEGMALGAAGFRIMEGTFHCLGAALILILAGLSRKYIEAPPADRAQYLLIGDLLRDARQILVSVVGILCWCAGAALYYALFYKARLVPRWLSLWGLLGIALAASAAILVLFGRTTDKEALHTLLNLPIALQEMVLALWLIVKGFDPKAAARREA